MKKIIETVSGPDLKFESLEAAQSYLKILLGGKKFLLVLDDVWNEDQDKWNKLKSPLNFGAAGSCILLTTREVGVASIARAHDQHKLPVLSKDQCWRVFKESASFDENQENGELVVIGKQIAEKCGGLPLAAKSLGGSLRSTRDEYAWELIRDSPLWDQTCDILPALKLSLDRLDTHSRSCFTFCCVFPKGYEMKKEFLIQLWMANDLIPFHSRLELEDMGNKFFNDLVVKSFFQVGRDPVIITMHDLMHDLCLYFRKECFCLEGLAEIPLQIEHLSVLESYPLKTNLLEILSKSHSSLRTCIFLDILYGKEKINFKPLHCLRVLKLENARLEDLPISIGKVKDLKYLNLCGNPNLTHLPNSIGDLIKLQTLKLKRCCQLTQLPEGITRLVNLRHLDLCECRRLTHLPDGIGGLMNLRHLDLSASCWMLTHLPDGIGRLMNLRHLDLSWCISLTHLPDGIGGLLNLRHLDLSECRSLTHLPGGIGGLMNLRHLDLSGCRSLTHLPGWIGRLIELRHLDLSRCTDLIQLPDDMTGLVKLEHLHLNCCHQSRHLPNGMDQLVNLRNLTLDSFVMGQDDGQRIMELKRLNGLKGELMIQGLENVRDATEAILKEKKNLSSLRLIWGSSQGSDSSSSDEAEAVLEALQPHQSLNKKLSIEGYGGSVFPTWMELLHNLVEIELGNCIKCERLPPLGQLLHLRDLTITGLRSLKCIDTEFYGSSGGHIIFPSLVSLTIEDMPKLEEWQEVQLKDNQKACPYLERLNIQRCESLKSLPECLRNLSNLKSLDVRNCDQLELSSGDFQSLISLKWLELADLPKLTSFPALQHFSKLGFLTIKGCKNLIRLGPQGMMQNPTIVDYVWFDDCEQLELSSTDFQHLIHLKQIYLYSLPKLTSLPQLQHLHSLGWLLISNCKNLKRLPHWLQNITSLRYLEITECHADLKLRCAKDTGEYWPFIKHIPDIRIEGEQTPPST